MSQSYQNLHDLLNAIKNKKHSKSQAIIDNDSVTIWDDDKLLLSLDPRDVIHQCFETLGIPTSEA